MINKTTNLGGIVFAVIIVSLLSGSIALAAAPPADPARPGSGTVLKGVKPPAVDQPTGQTPSITVEDRQPVIGGDSGQKIAVQSFKIGGESPVSAGELLKLVQSEAGKETTLGELNKLAARITKHLRQQGYLVAFAYIPAQTITDGVVEIAVVPGKYDQINIKGDSKFDADRLRAMLFCARPGAVIKRAPLERALLLMSDISGITVKATLTPGGAAGTADLILETADTAKTSAALYSDNWGNRYTGRVRYGVQLVVHNASGFGDDFTLGGLTTGEGINNYSFGYSAPLGVDGAKLEIKHSRVGYTLGGDFADLGATGHATVTSYSVSYPLVRARTHSLYGTAGYDVKHLRDDITYYDSYSPKTSGLWNIGLTGNFADSWLGGGNNAFGVTHYRGKLSINDADAAATDASYTNTAGNFAKTLFTFQRQQYMAKNLAFNFSFTGQLADKNLDSSEKLFLGGADGVRAYPQGEGAGDEGYKLTGEFRWRLPGLSSGKNNLYLNTFYDYGSVMTSKKPYSTDANRRSLMGAGLGLLWTRDRDFAIRLDYAWKIGEEAATADTDKSGRIWLQGVKYF